MSMRIDQTCSRCHRDVGVVVTDVAEAVKTEKLLKIREETLASIKAFVEKIPPENRPGLFVVMGDAMIAHSHLCNDPKNKRSCAKRVLELMDGLAEFDERKPRTKKEELTDEQKAAKKAEKKAEKKAAKEAAKEAPKK